MNSEEDQLKDFYKSQFKTSYTFYIPLNLIEEIKSLCKESKMPMGLFAYVALKKELEHETLRKRMQFCEPM